MQFPIGLPGLLLVVFVTLKLCGVIAWSWWWVMSPLWIVIIVAIGAVTVVEIAKAARE